MFTTHMWCPRKLEARFGKVLVAAIWDKMAARHKEVMDDMVKPLGYAWDQDKACKGFGIDPPGPRTASCRLPRAERHQAVEGPWRTKPTVANNGHTHSGGANAA